MAAEARSLTFRNILRQEQGFFDTTSTGELCSRLAADTSLLTKLLTSTSVDAARSGFMAVGAGSALVLISPSLGVLCARAPLYSWTRLFALVISCVGWWVAIFASSLRSYL